VGKLLAKYFKWTTGQSVLMHLRLNSTRLGDAGINSLCSSLSKSESLLQLQVADNGIESVEALVRSLPT